MFNFIASLILYSLFFSSQASTNGAILGVKISQVPGPRMINENILGVKISAPYAVIIDSESSKILFEKEKNLQTPLASITKLMSAMVFLENNPGWDISVIVQKDDIRDGGVIALAPGDTISVRDLFNLSLITSSNEATNALARSSGLSMDEFVKKMNQKAKALGLEFTYFIEPTGLEPANISTAFETAVMARQAFKQKEIRDAVVIQSFTAKLLNSKKRIVGKSTDKLLDSFINNKEFNYSIVGAKTGYIKESSYNFAAEVEKDGHRIMVVVLGSASDDDRWKDSKGLVDWAFTNFYWPE